MVFTAQGKGGLGSKDSRNVNHSVYSRQKEEASFQYKENVQNGGAHASKRGGMDGQQL